MTVVRCEHRFYILCNIGIYSTAYVSFITTLSMFCDILQLFDMLYILHYYDTWFYHAIYFKFFLCTGKTFYNVKIT